MRAGPSGWAIKANFPALNSGRVFRLDWFDLFSNFIVYMLIVVALFTKVIPQVCKAPSIVNSSSICMQINPTMLDMALALQLEIDSSCTM